MKILGNGDIFVVDLESLVVLDCNGCCISKYFHKIFSQRGCIHNTEAGAWEAPPASPDRGGGGPHNFTPTCKRLGIYYLAGVLCRGSLKGS